jgi:peptide/nickel transport system substrate-binding protein
MQSKLRLLLVLGAFIALTLTVSACGGDDDGDGDGAAAAAEFAPVTEAPADAKEGGTMTILATADIDFMDPGAAYYQFTYMLTDAVHRKLLWWPPDETAEPHPDLAEEAPEISDDGLTITFTLREGVQFSPPVDREVVAADIEYAIERGLLPGVANGYMPLYFADVVGFEDAQKEATDNPTGGAPDIEGITAEDDRTLVIELEQPTALGLVQSLSLPISAPVPEEYAREFDAENPSTYGQHVVFTGPYMVENNAEGELTGYTSGREINVVRNPNWDPELDERPAYLDRIEFREGFDDTASAARKVLNGSASVNGDFSPPPTTLREAATESEEGQLQLVPSGGNRYVAMNTQAPPFDDINVRKAVIAASDREALRATRGGELVGEIATHFIPPGVPGFEEAGGFEGDTELDFVQNPAGDPELAAEYMREAGYESGQCEGPECEITVIGEDAPPDKDTAQVVVDQLEELGFEVSFRLVDADVLYTGLCDVPERQPDICPNVGWIKDFNDGQAILEVPFNGENILPSNNFNWPQLDVPEINDALNEARLLTDPEERAQAYGEIDSTIMAQAPAIPWIWDDQANIRSSDLNGVINLFNAQWDLSYTSLK